VNTLILPVESSTSQVTCWLPISISLELVSSLPVLFQSPRSLSTSLRGASAPIVKHVKEVLPFHLAKEVLGTNQALSTLFGIFLCATLVP